MTTRRGNGPDRGPQAPDNWHTWSEAPLDGGKRAKRRLFHGREIYRRRRVMDAARLLPALGTVLLMMPMLWAADRGTAAGVVYLFAVWLGLIVAAALLSWRIAEPLRQRDRAGRTDPGAGGG